MGTDRNRNVSHETSADQRRRGTRCFGAGFALAVASMVAGAAPVQAQDTEREMVEAVIETFALEDRQVYLVPALELSPDMVQSGMQGRIRHSPKTLERIRQRFEARTMYLEEAVHCSVPDRADTCILPGNGILFHFNMPEPLQNGILPIRVAVYSSRGAAGQGLTRELWEFTLSRQPRVGWTVLNRRRVASG